MPGCRLNLVPQANALHNIAVGLCFYKLGSILFKNWTTFDELTNTKKKTQYIYFIMSSSENKKKKKRKENNKFKKKFVSPRFEPGSIQNIWSLSWQPSDGMSEWKFAYFLSSAITRSLRLAYIRTKPTSLLHYSCFSFLIK